MSKIQTAQPQRRGDKHGWRQRQRPFPLIITCKFSANKNGNVSSLQHVVSFRWPIWYRCRADLFEDDEIRRLLQFRSWWTKLGPSPEQEEEPGMFVLTCLCQCTVIFKNKTCTYKYVASNASAQYAVCILVSSKFVCDELVVWEVRSLL